MEKKIAALESSVSTLTGQVAQASASGGVAQLHGSGTTNPSKFFWKVMDLFEDRAKMPIYMTYRGVGSSTGQFEFLGENNPDGANHPYNHFGSGDIPMSSTNYGKLTTPMVHIPFVMGAIAIFHSVPASMNDGKAIKLTGCLLAKIFSRNIKTWDHADIKALNPSLSVPADTNIKVVHRVHGSSSTAGTTAYLEKTCPGDWKLGSGSTITWPSGTAEAQGSGNMAKYIAENDYAIGYLDAGHGHSLGFEEIALKNKKGQSLTSKEADISAAGDSVVLPSDPTADFSGVNLYDLDGDKVWPITLVSYLYVKSDLSLMSAETGMLLKGFIEYVLSTEGQEMVKDFSFTPVPKKILDYNKVTLGGITWPRDMKTLSFESSGTTRKGDGALTTVISGKRKSYAEVERDELAKKVAELEETVANLKATKPAEKEEEEADNTLTIVAIILGAVALLLSCVTLALALKRRRGHKSLEDGVEPNTYGNQS